MDCVTIVSIIISGLLSLAISWLFFYFSNRNTLKIAVICPIINLLDNAPNRANNKELNRLLSDYSSRYLHWYEIRVIRRLSQAYENVSGYSEDAANASILISYFEYVLKKNKINPKPVPMQDDEGEIFDWGYPDGVWDLERSIRSKLEEYPPDFLPDECQADVKVLFNMYAKEIYGADTINFFSDYSIEDVLKKSTIRKKWDGRFKEFTDAKEQFNKLGVVKNCK